mmetsp:Transcript_2734/g.2867  ORF Transcript_2734/g.2867 Transcript_2734/m.2867 type:complete len:515 (-) Transcript_2734:402-1946(-)|eukprot:CAMPEP_0119049540 /NCGR_PEP_ID=MMETSP1177-20130426/65309_1 /TAXON_ID=2985 /ORGANISM="Ochromonas sp, Strain CCMP1899" /LENGTH=514 /DNA_ID=CAMNT_0007026941 /DNA_START=128 /DNA_END=1672 /DNA_ORIENTATION=-
MEVLISLENFEDGGETAREINSPRSLESCLRSGIDPSELYPRPYDSFHSKNLTKEMVDIKFDRNEKKRREKITIVKMERNSIIQYAERHNRMTGSITQNDAPSNFVDTIKEAVQRDSAMIVIEERRIEALKRRQEKELAKIVEREQIMIALQSKIKGAEDEDNRKTKLNLKKGLEQKNQASKKNVVRLQELAIIEREEAAKKKEKAKKEHDHALKVKTLKDDEEKRLIREVRLRDKERAEKIEESRRKTDLLIQAQIDIGEENRLKMLERELCVQTQLHDKREAKKEEVRSEKEKAIKRIGEALDRHHLLHEDKKSKFHERQKEASMRAGECVNMEKQKQKKQGDDRDKKNKLRLGRLLDAYKIRTSHRHDIVEKRSEKDKTYDRVQAERESHQAMLKFASDMKIHDKIENVERVARMNEFHRLQTLKRIEDAESRYDNIQRQRAEISYKHGEEVKLSLTRKHELSNVMDQMRISNDFSMLDKLFVSKKNKATTAGNTMRDNADGDEDRLNQTA